jgi:hypothetical protein
MKEIELKYLERKEIPAEVEPRPSEAVQATQVNIEINFTDKIWRSFDQIKYSVRPGSSLSSLFTIIISTVGGTILYMPSAFMASGIIWSTIQICICGAMGYYSGTMLVKLINLNIAFFFPLSKIFMLPLII